MIWILAGAGLLDKVDLTMARRLILPTTAKLALVCRRYLSSNPNLLSVGKPSTLGSWLMELLFQLPKPSCWKGLCAWQIGAITRTSARVNFLPLEVSTSDNRLDELTPAFRNMPWLTSLTELQRRAKANPILSGLIYRGAYQHIKLDAGGNDLAQLKVASKGVVTTSEKNTITLSADTTVQNVKQRSQASPKGEPSQPASPPTASNNKSTMKRSPTTVMIDLDSLVSWFLCIPETRWLPF